MKRLLLAAFVLLLFISGAFAAQPAKVYVVLWFDTEDYILPASDDAALRLADWLSKEGIRATFKVVGEKARVLEQRRRDDVIAALKKHEIGYHSNQHSTQPSPALYLSNLGWDEGVAEFDRREGQGRADVERIFGQAPTCYGQPGSSWAPQSFGAMRKWGMHVYLDSGSHVQLDGKPHYYCGALTLYRLTHTLRADLHNPGEVETAKERFAAARKALLAEGGGVVSIFYHPCEFVHKEFWDGVNFRNGANPPRDQWKLPPAQTEEQSKQCFRIFDDYVRFIKRFDDVQFITASEAEKLYRDGSRREFPAEELKAIAAAAAGGAIAFQRRADCALSASEVFMLLNDYVALAADAKAAPAVRLESTPFGPTGDVPALSATVTTDASQFRRTAVDVADFIRKQCRIPSSVWLGSTPVPPESFLRALAGTARELLEGKPLPDKIEIRPSTLTVEKYVSADDPKLWGWVIFPRGFAAPEMMKLAKKQAWTIKPALLH